MLLIHGTYHWRARRIAFRNDFCRTCAQERLALLVRTFDVFHVFWVPVLPLGFWSRWFCTQCGSPPHVSTKTRRGFKVAGAVVCAFAALSTWAVPIAEVGEDAWIVWLMRIAMPLLTVVAVRWAFKHPVEPRFLEMLAAVKPFQGWSCPLCSGPLLPDGHADGRCTQCGAEHRPLRKKAA